MLIPLVFELKTWKMSQFMTLTDGDKCLIERYEFVMNYAMTLSLKVDGAEPKTLLDSLWGNAASGSWMNINNF